jgi:hypothetical protein
MLVNRSVADEIISLQIPIWQCCGSGSGQIRNFYQDQDTDTDLEKIFPDPTSSGSEMNFK